MRKIRNNKCCTSDLIFRVICVGCGRRLRHVTTSQLVVFRARYLCSIPVSLFASTSQTNIDTLSNISSLATRKPMIWLFKEEVFALCARSTWKSKEHLYSCDVIFTMKSMEIHEGLPPVSQVCTLSWGRHSRSLRDLRVLRQDCLVKQAWSTLLPSPTLKNGFVMILEAH